MLHLLTTRFAIASSLAIAPLFSPVAVRSSVPNACTLVPRADLERIVGHIAAIGKPIVVQNPPGSQGCTITRPDGAAFILVVRPTRDAAKVITDAVRRPQEHAQPDTVAGQPAEYIQEAKMFATGKGNTIVSVIGLSRDQARQVLTVALRHL